MGIFFNIGTDINLLHKSVREHPEVDTVAGQVEQDVLSYYRQSAQRLGSYGYGAFFDNEYGVDPDWHYYIRLAGYNSDDPGSSNPNLSEALKRTIADVISYHLRNYDNDRGLEAESRGDRSWDYADGGLPDPNEWPDGWNRRLAIYDNREAVYAL